MVLKVIIKLLYQHVQQVHILGRCHSVQFNGVDADIMVAGGAEATLCDVVEAAFAAASKEHFQNVTMNLKSYSSI